MNNKDYSSTLQFQSKLLIVDDDPQHLEMLCDCIEGHVSEIIKATNGIESIAKAKAYQPDLILMDVMMPDMNGFNACLKIKEDPITKDIPVIFITALNDLDSILKGFSCGGVDYVSKPFHTKEIVSRLKIHLKLQFQHRQLMDMAIELKATKEEAEAARIVAEKANQAKTNFLCNVSHELMTPMNVIQNMANFALEDSLNPKQTDYLQKIKTSSEMLKELIDDMLDYSTIEIGDAIPHQELFQLEDVLQSVYEKLFSKIKDNNQVKLILSQDPMIPNNLMGDATRLQKIIFHLGDNAIKFTSSGYVEIKSRLLENKNNEVSIAFSVKDTGIGMRKAQQEFFFQPFTQADASKTRKHGGIGLGLALCRQLIKLMNGKLSVNSIPDKGSIVTLQLDFVLSEPQKRVINNDGVINDEKNISNKKNIYQSKKELVLNTHEKNQLIGLLNQLDGHIKKRNPKKCKLIFEKIKTYNLDSMDEHVQKLENKLRRYIFNEARNHLSHLIEALNERNVS